MKYYKSATSKGLNVFLLSVVLSLSFSYTELNAATKTASTGNWGTAGTWSPSGVPTCGDSIIIPAGVTVTVNNNFDYYAGCGSPAMKIRIFGRLDFDNGRKLKLPCGSYVIVYSGGSITDAGGGGNSNTIEICNVVVWNAGSGTANGPTCFPPGCLTTLPITLLYFNAQVTDANDVVLTWATASELNNDYFTVERSADGVHFTTVFTVDAAGTSTSTINYSAKDNEPLHGVSYYRLKQTDYDGAYTYSNIVAVNIEIVDIISLYPNPANDNVTLLVVSPSESNISVAICNVLGQTEYVSVQEIKMGVNILKIETSFLAQGSYLLIVTTSDLRQIHKQFVIH